MISSFLCLNFTPFSTESLQLDNDACAKVNSMIIPCCEDLIELKSDHNHKIEEITDNAGKCLLDEYVVSLRILIRTKTATFQTLYLVLQCGDIYNMNVVFGGKQVDESSCSTPRKRPIEIPSIESIEELRTPASEELLRRFRDEKVLKQANGDAKQQQQNIIRASSLYEAVVSDSRFPLSAVN